MGSLLLLDIAFAIFALVFLKLIIFTKRSTALPPGPSKLPLLGNLPLKQGSFFFGLG